MKQPHPVRLRCRIEFTRRQRFLCAIFSRRGSRAKKGGELQMGIHTTSPMVDAFGVPTYYVTDIVQEDAGNGNVRIWLCTKRANVLIPQCELIMAAQSAVNLSFEAQSFASGITNRCKAGAH
jgi:hypothetical protein